VNHRFTIIDAPQRSPAWFAARAGKVTGSRAADVLASIKTGEAAARRDYRMQLVVERVTGELQDDSFVSPAMMRGVECEPLACSAYEAATGQIVQHTGFLASLDDEAGCSLDGHIGDFEGIVEIKAPKAATHLRYLRASSVPPEHLPQVLHNCFISGAQWCDFVSFDDRFPTALQLVILRYERNEDEIAAYAAKARAFLAEVATETAALRTMADVGAVLRAAVAV
jgi:hypothetical protein